MQSRQALRAGLVSAAHRAADFTLYFLL